MHQRKEIYLGKAKSAGSFSDFTAFVGIKMGAGQTPLLSMPDLCPAVVADGGVQQGCCHFPKVKTFPQG